MNQQLDMTTPKINESQDNLLVLPPIKGLPKRKNTLKTKEVQKIQATDILKGSYQNQMKFLVLDSDLLKIDEEEEPEFNFERESQLVQFTLPISRVIYID